MEKIVFAKPHAFEGKEYPEIELDFESLTGQESQSHHSGIETSTSGRA
jgi:hypothetical protein